LVVGNRVADARKGGLLQGEVEKALGAKLAAVIPEDPAAVPTALNTGKPLPAASPGSQATVALKRLADSLDGTSTLQRAPLLSRFFQSAKNKDGKP
jgi:Flp pilus assembly CpaE family ATPase